MNIKDKQRLVSELKRFSVLGRCFVYNEKTARHVELDSKTWHRLARMMREKEKTADVIAAIPELSRVLDDRREINACADKAVLRNLILQVSHACNLRCRYCSADFGRYGGISREMSLSSAQKAIDFLFDNSPATELAITYFGGEPLLNLDTVLSSARYAKAKAEREGQSLSLHLVTNGVLLKPETLFRFDELGFSLTVSIDGPKKCHDLCRLFPDGRGSQRIVSGFLEVAGDLPIGRRVTMRGTFTRQSASFFPNVRFLAGKGWSRNIAYEPVFLPSSHPLSLRWQDLPAIKQSYTDLARYYVRQWKRGEAFCLWDFDDAITQLALARPRLSRCGAGVATVAVTAEEEIYACHMSTGMADAKLGDLQTGLVKNHCRPWRERYLKGRTGCEKCWLHALCGGGCNTHALFYNGALCRPYRLECELIEHRYRLAFWILAEIPGLKDNISAHFRAAANDAGHLLSPLWSYGDVAEKDEKCAFPD